MPVPSSKAPINHQDVRDMDAFLSIADSSKSSAITAAKSRCRLSSDWAARSFGRNDQILDQTALPEMNRFL